MGEVVAVASSREHHFSKERRDAVTLIAGMGVEGDAHAGVTVKHRSRVVRDPTQPNLRQVHLLHEELFALLRKRGFAVEPGSLGENITTRGIDLLALPRGTRLRLGNSAEVEITGLRNPCLQLDQYQAGLTQAVLDRDTDGNLLRLAGVMAIVIAGGPVLPGNPISIHLSAEPHAALKPV